MESALNLSSSYSRNRHRLQLAVIWLGVLWAQESFADGQDQQTFLQRPDSQTTDSSGHGFEADGFEPDGFQRSGSDTAIRLHLDDDHRLVVVEVESYERALLGRDQQLETRQFLLETSPLRQATMLQPTPLLMPRASVAAPAPPTGQDTSLTSELFVTANLDRSVLRPPSAASTA